jgi:hypothetical protein
VYISNNHRQSTIKIGWRREYAAATDGTAILPLSTSGMPLFGLSHPRLFVSSSLFIYPYQSFLP